MYVGEASAGIIREGGLLLNFAAERCTVIDEEMIDMSSRKNCKQ
jgi:hypothetical protein